MVENFKIHISNYGQMGGQMLGLSQLKCVLQREVNPEKLTKDFKCNADLRFIKPQN